jgi:hypothetical protein
LQEHVFSLVIFRELLRLMTHYLRWDYSTRITPHTRVIAAVVNDNVTHHSSHSKHSALIHSINWDEFVSLYLIVSTQPSVTQRTCNGILWVPPLQRQHNLPISNAYKMDHTAVQWLSFDTTQSSFHSQE